MTNQEAIKIIENRFDIMDYGESEELGEALDVAIKALEQQKIGTWKPHGKSIGGRHTLWKCTVCGCIIFSEDEQDRTTFHKYCGMCGARMEDTT